MDFQFKRIKSDLGDNTLLVETMKNGSPVGKGNTVELDELGSAIAALPSPDSIPKADAIIISGVPTFAVVSLAMHLKGAAQVHGILYTATQEFIITFSNNPNIPVGLRVPSTLGVDLVGS